MINRQFFSVLLFLLLAAGSMASTVCAAGKGFYADGQLKWEYLFEDGAISEARWYDESGQMVSREVFLAGKLEKAEGYRADGSLEWQTKPLGDDRQGVVRFDINGQMTALYQTVAGQADGEYKTFYGDGQEKQIVNYRQGVLHGPATTFFANGRVEHEFAYKNGEVDGIYRTYSAEGNLLTEYTFRNGQLQ